MPEPLTLAVTRPPRTEVLGWSYAGGCCDSLACDSHDWERWGHSILARPRTVL